MNSNVTHNSCPVLDESHPVRYRFESAEALHKHLAAEGFFVADPSLPGKPGSRVIVEIDFEGAARSLVRGRLCSRERDGVWLELATSHTTAWWNANAALHRRKQRRLGCDLFAEVRPSEGAPWFCRAVDLSEGGMRIETGPFQSLLAGDRVLATIISSDPRLKPAELPARVAWAWGREAGLTVLDASVELSGLVAGLKWRWDEVPEIVHADGCYCGTAGHRHP